MKVYSLATVSYMQHTNIIFGTYEEAIRNIKLSQFHINSAT